MNPKRIRSTEVRLESLVHNLKQFCPYERNFRGVKINLSDAYGSYLLATKGFASLYHLPSKPNGVDFEFFINWSPQNIRVIIWLSNSDRMKEDWSPTRLERFLKGCKTAADVMVRIQAELAIDAALKGE